MRLFELFNKIADWSWDEEISSSDVAKFYIGRRSYYIQFDNTMFDVEHFNGIFDIEDDDAVICAVAFYLAGVKPTGKSGTDVTGTGGAFEVFATVKAIIDWYVKSNPNIDYLHFSASEASRIKLYDRFLKNYPGRVEQLPWRDDPDSEDKPSMHYMVKL